MVFIMPCQGNKPVFDTSVLVAFSSVLRMGLLQSLAPKAVIPGAVFRELVVQGSGWHNAEAAQCEARAGSWLRTVHLDQAGVTLVGSPSLDDGEREVISLALAWGATPVIDEPLGRREAQKLGLHPIGTLGLLGVAKRQGRINAIGPIIEEMTWNGLRFGNTLIREFLLAFNEDWPS
jgi:uncharacterized protein